MNRRQLIVSAAAGSLALTGLGRPPRALAATPTDDELAYASFGQATELLLGDFYARALAAKVVVRSMHLHALSRGAHNAREHAAALAGLLRDAGQTPAVAEDFAFAWPDGTFATARSLSATGVELTQSLLGTYLSAAATISIPSYRTLYASMSASVAQQAGALALIGGGRSVGNSFPPALDVETASDRIEAYLG